MRQTSDVIPDRSAAGVAAGGSESPDKQIDPTAAEITREGLWKKYKLGPIQHVWRLIVGLVAVHVGTLVIVALYYLAFEINPSATHWWHSTVSNGDLRHTIRDVAEGVLGAFLAKAVVWNHFTKKHVTSGRVYDRLKNTFHIPETPAAILASLVIFAFLFTVGYVVLEALNVHAVAASKHGGVWVHTRALWTDGYVNKALAFVCAFIAVRPLHNMYDDIQGYFAGRRALDDRPPPFFYPANFKNRYRFLRDFPEHRKAYGNWTRVVMPILVILVVGLAVYGWYILAYVA